MTKYQIFLWIISHILSKDNLWNLFNQVPTWFFLDVELYFPK